MRLIVPSASIGVLAGACRLSLASAVDGTGKEQIAKDNSDGFAGVANSQVVHDVDAAYEDSLRWPLGKECNTFDSKRDGGKKVLSDVGILRCGKDQTCVPDDTSLAGGRCASYSDEGMLDERPTVPIFSKRRLNRHVAQRHLQLDERQVLRPDGGNATATNTTEAPFVCPPKCPQAFCDCAQADGDAEVCAPELHLVCERNRLPDCVPDKYLPFYEQTYCPFASCLSAEGRPYEMCGCEYYQDYCELYYNFNESVYKCAISTCCQGNGPATKYQCLPELTPTRAPTVSPTDGPTEVPTASPSDAPSASPSWSPSASPTASTMPTASPSASPTAFPSVSSRPTPQFAPSDFPSASPTGSPSDSPTDSPSGSPSASPTAEPTSAAPTDAPTDPPVEPLDYPDNLATSDASENGGDVDPDFGEKKITTQSSGGGAVRAASGMGLASLVAGLGGALWLALG